MFPVEEKIGEIAAALARNRDVVLTAPPGSGKTTCVPPALLDEPWLKGKKIVTEGLLTNRILADPELKDVGLVIFDEFHERSLQCDLAFALALEVRRALRPDLRILVMSAPKAACSPSRPCTSATCRCPPRSQRRSRRPRETCSAFCLEKERFAERRRHSASQGSGIGDQGLGGGDSDNYAGFGGLDSYSGEGPTVRVQD